MCMYIKKQYTCMYINIHMYVGLRLHVFMPDFSIYMYTNICTGTYVHMHMYV